VVGCLLLLAASDWIVSLLPTEEMKLRLTEVFAFFKEGDSTGYNLNGRLSLYWRSIKAFFKSPIIGTVTLNFDPHSSILRFFARDGILGGVGYLLLYYLGYRIVLKYFIGEKKKKFFTPVFLALILMGLVNPIHSVGAVHYIVFLVAPLTLSLIEIEEIDEEEENEEALGN
jgi:O-antigen ligase